MGPNQLDSIPVACWGFYSCCPLGLVVLPSCLQPKSEALVSLCLCHDVPITCHIPLVLDLMFSLCSDFLQLGGNSMSWRAYRL